MKPQAKFIGYDKVLHDALVMARNGALNPAESRIQALERRLETSKLTHQEIADIQKQLKQLRGGK